VSIKSGVLDLYSPKFRLDDLGHPGEKIILRIQAFTGVNPLVLFSGYTVGSRHAQLSTNQLVGLGDSVLISEISRYILEDAIKDINGFLEAGGRRMGLELATKESEAYAFVESRRLPVHVKRMYTVGGTLFLILQILGKRIRLELSSNGVTLYDSSRRELIGLTLVGNRLTLRRKFQHAELATNSGGVSTAS